MPIPEPLVKVGSFLVEHIRDWGWAVAGWFKPEAQRQRHIYRLLAQLGEVRRDLVRGPTNREYPDLLRRAERFGRAAADFHNADTTVSSAMIPPSAAAPPPEAGWNTTEGRHALAFWLEWHRQFLASKRDGPPPERRRRSLDERRGP